jgi:hypothetical protein
VSEDNRFENTVVFNGTAVYWPRNKLNTVCSLNSAMKTNTIIFILVID